MIHAMAKATFEKREDGALWLLPHGTFPQFVQDELAQTDPIPLDCDLRVAICAREDQEMSEELDGYDDLPGVCAAGYGHVWLAPCHEGGDPSLPVSGVKVRYQ